MNIFKKYELGFFFVNFMLINIYVTKNVTGNIASNPFTLVFIMMVALGVFYNKFHHCIFWHPDTGT